MNNTSMPPQGPSIIEEHQKRTCCALPQRTTRCLPLTPEPVIIGTLRRLTKGDVCCPPLPSPSVTNVRHEPLTQLSSQWKVLILDATTKDLVYNTVKEDDILNQNIASMLRLGRCGSPATLTPCRYRDD